MQSDIWDSNGAIPMMGPAVMEVEVTESVIDHEPVDPRAVAAIAQLSPREREVLQELVDGKSHEAAAQDLFISHHTFRTHVKNILTKLDAHSSIQAVSIAVCAGVRPSSMRSERAHSTERGEIRGDGQMGTDAAPDGSGRTATQ